jgi:hypothetical protein
MIGSAEGAMRRERQAQQAEAPQQKAEQKYEANVDGYKRAFTACMTGRGYTVS